MNNINEIESYMNEYINNLLNISIFDYIDEKYKYENIQNQIKLHTIRNTKIKDICVSYTPDRKFDIYNYIEGKKLENYKFEFIKLIDNNDLITNNITNMQCKINSIIINILGKYFKNHLKHIGDANNMTIPTDINISELEQNELNYYSKYKFCIQDDINKEFLVKINNIDNNIGQLLLRIEKQEEALKKINNLKSDNQGILIDKLNIEVKTNKINYYYKLIYLFLGFIIGCLTTIN